MPLFNIKALTQSAASQQPPVPNAWYCGFQVPDQGDPIDGMLAQWSGHEFVDEDGEPVDMNDYDYLVQQH
jgi:hypothetical protein